MNITRTKRQQGLNYAKVLSQYAVKAPDDEIKSAVYKVVNATRQKYGYTREDKKAEILRCVSLGASTRDDLLRETPFNKQELQELLNELVSLELLRTATAQLNCVGPKVSQYFPMDG